MTRPAFPPPLVIVIPAAVSDGESVEAALCALAAIDEESASLRRFLRDGATYRRETGRTIPLVEWDAAHDRIHDLARLRQRVQEALGAHRRQRTSFDRAFVNVARERLEPTILGELTAAAQHLAKGAGA